MASMIVVPTLLMMNDDKDFKKIAIVEEGSDLFKNVIPNTKDAEYVYLEDANIGDLKKSFAESGYYGILYISKELVSTPNAIQLISKNQPPIGLSDMSRWDGFDRVRVRG
jgi:hypothetical protein